MAYRSPSIKSVMSSTSVVGLTPPLPSSSPPPLPSRVNTPYLDNTPRNTADIKCLDFSDDGDDKENRANSSLDPDDDHDETFVERQSSSSGSTASLVSNPGAFLPSTPSCIPLIDESPLVDPIRTFQSASNFSVNSSFTGSHVPDLTRTPALPHIRSRSGNLPMHKLRHASERASFKPLTGNILPTPLSSSSSFSTSFLCSTEKSSSLQKFRYTALWNGALAALRENVAVKRRKRGGFGLLSSAAGNLEIFSGQDATNVLLNYLLEKQSEFTSVEVDRSKAIKLGQNLMNNGYYKPVKKSGGSRSRESRFEDSASKFYLFSEKESASLNKSTSLLSTSSIMAAAEDEDGGVTGFQERRNSMRNRKGRIRHPSDPGTPHSRSSKTVRKRSSNGNLLNIAKLEIDENRKRNGVNCCVSDVTPISSPNKEIGGIVNPAFSTNSTTSTTSIPEEVKEIFGPLKNSVQDSIQRVSSSATRFSRSVFSTSSLRNHGQQLQTKTETQETATPFGLRSSFGKGNRASTENFRAPGKLRRVFSQSDLRGVGSSSSTSLKEEEGPALVTPAVEAEILREAALSRLFTLVDMNILDDVIAAVDVLSASDTLVVSEGLLVPKDDEYDDDDDWNHEVLSRWDSQGSLFPMPVSNSPQKSPEPDTIYHQWLVASSELLEALPPQSPNNRKQHLNSFNNVAFDVETLDERCLRLFQTTSDAVLSCGGSAAGSSKKRQLPILLPPSLTPIYSAISELLCLGRDPGALLASQLLLLLIPSQRRIILLKLLKFMNVAVFNSSIRLLIGKSNTSHVFESFAPVVFGKKHAVQLPDWKAFLGHLVRHAEELKEVPQEIKDAVEDKVNLISLRSTAGAHPSLRRSSRFRRSAVQYCKTIPEESYEEEKVTKTTDALRELFKSIQNDPTMDEETKNKYLEKMLASHPNLFVTQL